MSDRSKSGLARLFTALRPSDSEHVPLAAPEFQRVFLREKALADRGSRDFSMILVRPEKGLRATEVLVGDAVEDRMRLGDVLGRWDSSHLAVLLAGTNAAGAQLYADELERKLSTRGVQARVTIFADTGRAPGGRRATDAEPDAAEPSPTAPPRSTGTAGPRPEARPEPAPLVEAQPESPPLAAIHVHPSAKALREARVAKRPIEDLEQLSFADLPFWKRSMDVVASGVALVGLSPFLLGIALAVRLSSPGPVLFIQQRAGVGGVPFPFYKFRSMVVDAEALKANLACDNEKDGPIFKIKNDPRVTRIGRFIRRYSLDELPQLYNVLIGDMTLVGPRPPTMDEVAEYEPWQRQRLLIRGGLTCTWQVSGRSDVSFEDWMRMDARYARTSGFFGDLKLLLKTVKAIFTGRGAY